VRKSYSVTGNFIFNLLNQILTVTIPLITIPYLSRTLGPAGIGEYSFSLSLVTYFSLFANLGVNLYGQRQIAYQKLESREAYSKTFWELCLFRCATGALSLSLYFLLISYLSSNFLLSAVLSLEIVSVVFDISWLYRGFENFRIIVLRNLLVKILALIFIFTFVKGPSDVVVYALVMSGANLLGYATMWLTVRAYIVRVSFQSLNVWGHLKGTASLYLPQIATQIYTVLDKTMLGLITKSNLENGYYDQAHKVVLVLLTIITSFGPVMIPRISALYAQSDHKKIQDYIGQTFCFTWMLGMPMIFGIFAVADLFVPLFFGPGYDKVIILLKLFSLIIIPIAVGNNIGMQYLIPVGREKDLTRSYVMGATVNFILNSFMIALFSSVGATIASILAEVAVSSCQLWMVRKELPILQYLGSIKDFLLASIVMYIFITVCSPFLNGNNILQLAYKIIVGSIIYVLFLVVLKNKFTLQILQKIRIKFIKA
jgi:O-antigen/teichoic acid export membrane protein